MKKFKMGFILTTQLGNSTRFAVLKKYAERDSEVECVWAPIEYNPKLSNLIRMARKLPDALYWRIVVMHEASVVLRHFRLFDAIMVHQFEPSVVLSVARYFSRLPALVSSTDDTPLMQIRNHPMYANELRRSDFLQRLRLRLDLWRVRRADLSIPMSQWAASILVDLCGVEASTVYPIHVGLDLESWPRVAPRGAKPAGMKKLLFVGGDFERKGGPMLLRVHQEHFSERAELHLVTKHVLGGAYRNVSLYSDLNPLDARLKALYSECDIFVLPTNSDVSSWVALEAHASSLPVVITNVGGIADIVEDQHTGLLIDKGDEQALIRAIEMLLDDPQKCMQFGENGRKWVEERFNAETNVRRIIDLMKVASRSRSGAASG